MGDTDNSSLHVHSISKLSADLLWVDNCLALFYIRYDDSAAP